MNVYTARANASEVRSRTRGGEWGGLDGPDLLTTAENFSRMTPRENSSSACGTTCTAHEGVRVRSREAAACIHAYLHEQGLAVRQQQRQQRADDRSLACAGPRVSALAARSCHAPAPMIIWWHVAPLSLDATCGTRAVTDRKCAVTEGETRLPRE